MPNNVEISQRALPGASGTYIGVQNNYQGLTSAEASKIAIDLFMDNFPKLQAIAADTAKQRAEELVQDTLRRLEEQHICDYTPFTDPDVQFVLWEAQRDYARFGKKETLDILSSCIAERIKADKNEYLKVITDQAIQIINYLSPQHFDYLSALFILTKVKVSGINSLEDLLLHFAYINNVFQVDRINASQIFSLLNSLGCLQLSLPDIGKISSIVYNLPINQIQQIKPDYINQMTTDYGISDIGIIIAIINAELKTKWRFDPANWLHE